MRVGARLTVRWRRWKDRHWDGLRFVRCDDGDCTSGHPYDALCGRRGCDGFVGLLLPWLPPSDPASGAPILLLGGFKVVSGDGGRHVKMNRRLRGEWREAQWQSAS
jgi:hypothetical protein